MELFCSVNTRQICWHKYIFWEECGSCCKCQKRMSKKTPQEKQHCKKKWNDVLLSVSKRVHAVSSHHHCFKQFCQVFFFSLSWMTMNNIKMALSHYVKCLQQCDGPQWPMCRSFLLGNSIHSWPLAVITCSPSCYLYSNRRFIIICNSKCINFNPFWRCQITVEQSFWHAVG